jgi:hypothetical protein
MVAVHDRTSTFKKVLLESTVTILNLWGKREQTATASSTQMVSCDFCYVTSLVVFDYSICSGSS